MAYDPVQDPANYDDQGNYIGGYPNSPNDPALRGPGGVFNDGTSSTGGLNWNNIIALSYGLGSQALQAFGNHPSQQIGGIGVQGVGGGYSPSSQGYYSNNVPNAQQLALLRSNAAGGGVAEQTVGSIGAIVSQHPYFVFGAIAALFLLYRQPPSRR